MKPIWLGTSGFSYKEWKGSFYPADLPAKQMLQYYASQFRSVEIDSTFYRMPSPATLEGWRQQTPEQFRFTIKAPQQITHRQRLKTPSEAVDYFVATVPILGERLGLVLFQLPPFFRCDTDRLDSFLAILPRGLPSAFEFRHDSWFNDDVYNRLRSRGIGLCIHDADERTTPMVLTAGTTYVRLRRSTYSEEQRREWQERMRGWAEGGIEVFAYIKHEDNPDAPRIAREFAEGLV